MPRAAVCCGSGALATRAAGAVRGPRFSGAVGVSPASRGGAFGVVRAMLLSQAVRVDSDGWSYRWSYWPAVSRHGFQPPSQRFMRVWWSAFALARQTA